MRRELLMSYQSGQSLIEHSYKADSDLSPAGWEYAERLKEFVLERRSKSLEQRGLNPQDRKLVVCIPNNISSRLLLTPGRSGPRRIVARITLPGPSWPPRKHRISLRECLYRHHLSHHL